MNTRGGLFLHFGIVGANLFGGFGTFGGGNNNPPPENNNNPLSEFGKGLERGFNLLSGRNVRGLDSNVVALINILIEANLGINHVERESNHVKPTKFRGTEIEDLNEWLECYNRIAEANKWSEHRRFQIIGGYLVGVAAK